MTSTDMSLHFTADQSTTSVAYKATSRRPGSTRKTPGSGGKNSENNQHRWDEHLLAAANTGQ